MKGRATVGLDDFQGQNKDELSMIEVARTILQDSGKRMAFADIVNAVQNFLGKSDEEIRERLPQFYTDMNTDGEFISMGDNVWALRSWFPYESVDEEVNHPEDEDLDVDEEDTNEDDYSDDDLDDADDNELDDGIEGQLSELHQDDLDDDDE